jgi:hypothetical protein
MESIGEMSAIPEEWRGKVVYVYLRGGGGESLHTGIAMRDVRFESINERLFLVGRALSDPRDWLSDLPLLVLWDEIIHIAILNSPEDYSSRSERARAMLAHVESSDDTPQ